MTSVETHQGVAELLDRWQGTEVSVRITVGGSHALIAVSSGRIEARSDEKRPSLFWPLAETPSPDAERPGVYLHPQAFGGGRLHRGGFVLEFRHGNVTTNVRRLGRPAGGQAQSPQRGPTTGLAGEPPPSRGETAPPSAP